MNRSPESPVFEPDGWDCRARVGLLVPDRDVGPESEWSAMAPPGLLFNVSRFRFPTRGGDKIGIDAVDFVASPGPLEEAADLMKLLPLDIVALAFTSNSYVGDDNVLVDRIAAIVGNRPVITTGQAFIAAVAHLNARNVLLLDPPWFPDQLTAAGGQWLRNQGIGLVGAETAPLPTGQGNIHPAAVHRCLCQVVAAHADNPVDLILIGGNGFRTVGAIRAAEQDLGIPIVSANTALLWYSLRTLGRATGQVRGYGRLFS